MTNFFGRSGPFHSGSLASSRRPSFAVRAKTALQVFRRGFPGGTKALPFSWPSWKQGIPAWKLIDLQSYINEGFSLNTLVYSAIMYKVRAVITAPLRAYTGDPDYPETIPATHKIAKIVAQPNEHQSWTEFQSLNIVYLNLDGNVFILKDPVDGSMHSLRPDRVYIVPNKGKPAGILGFLYVPKGTAVRDGVPILPQDMIHIKLPNPGDNFEGMGYGMSPLSPAAQSADVDNMVTGFLNLFFKQGSMVTGVLRFESPLKPETVDIIKERWREQYGGYSKWDIGVLDRGAQYQRTALTFEEMGFGEIDERNETRILGPFGVPPILIGSRVGLARSTYSNYEGARKAFWEDTLVPEIRLFEVEYQSHLNEGDVFVKFDLSQVPALQKDLPVLISSAFTLWQMGVPANQALRAVGMRIGKVPGGDVPRSLTSPTAATDGQGQDQGPRTDADDDSWGQRSLSLALEAKCPYCQGPLRKAFPEAAHGTFRRAPPRRAGWS